MFGNFGKKFLVPKMEIKQNWPIVQKVNDLEKSMSALNQNQLIEKTIEFKNRINDEGLELILPEAFAVVREAAKER